MNYLDEVTIPVAIGRNVADISVSWAPALGESYKDTTYSNIDFLCGPSFLRVEPIISRWGVHLSQQPLAKSEPPFVKLRSIRAYDSLYFVKGKKFDYGVHSLVY